MGKIKIIILLCFIISSPLVADNKNSCLPLFNNLELELRIGESNIVNPSTSNYAGGAELGTSLRYRFHEIFSLGISGHFSFHNKTNLTENASYSEVISGASFEFKLMPKLYIDIVWPISIVALNKDIYPIKNENTGMSLYPGAIIKYSIYQKEKKTEESHSYKGELKDFYMYFNFFYLDDIIFNTDISNIYFAIGAGIRI